MKRVPREPDKNDEYDKALSHLKVPVCAKHTEDEDEHYGNAIEYSHGRLGFASYRYYRAFCELNHIGDARQAEGEK